MMGYYPKKEFLAYYKFKDEPETVPQYFHSGVKLYEKLLKDVEEDVSNGVKIKDSIRLRVGVTREIVNKWNRDFAKELSEGKTDTPLIRLFGIGLRADADYYLKVMKMITKKAEEGDASSMQYLAKHRLGYNSTRKQEVELSSKEEAPIQFVFKDMTPTENEEEEE